MEHVGLTVSGSCGGTCDFCYDPDYGQGISYDVSLALDARDVDRLSYSTDTAAASKCSVSDTTT